MATKWIWGLGVLVVAGAISQACSSSDDDENGGSGGGSTNASGGGAGTAAANAGAGGGVILGPDGGVVQVDPDGIPVTDDTGSFTCYQGICAGHLLECGDCEDNDDDGLVDSHDPECLGPCDNTEGPGLFSDVGGATGTSCGVDCYFDFGNGPGNDDCVWDHRCDTLQPELPTCPLDEDLIGGKQCPDVQSEMCGDFCKPYTPNGCDCFGCCTFPELATAGPDGGPGFVWIGELDEDNVSTCTFADIMDNEKCPPCTPIDNCYNSCETCEVCLGKPLPPAECFADAGTPTTQCSAGIQPCGLEGQAPCAATDYCISGCCVAQPR
jgi:hypothetical protein